MSRAISTLPEEKRRRTKVRPGPTITLTEEEASFVAFLMGHYVGLLYKRGLKVPQKTKRSAKSISRRVLTKLDESSALNSRLARVAAIVEAYRKTNTFDGEGAHVGDVSAALDEEKTP